VDEAEYGLQREWLARKLVDTDSQEAFQRTMTATLLRELTTSEVSGWPAGGSAG
jgi:hypothetical protein